MVNDSIVFWRPVRLFLVGLLLLAPIVGSAQPQQQNGVDPAREQFSITSSPSGALVYLNGEYEFVGRTPFVVPYGLFGRYQIKATMPGYESLNLSKYFYDETGNTLNFKLVQKTPGRAAFRSLLIPGWGQYYSGRKIGGTVISALTIAAFGATAALHRDYRNTQIEYDSELARLTNPANSFEEQQQAFNRLQDLRVQLDSDKTNRNTGLYVALGFWLYNIVESALFFPHDAQGVELFQKFNAELAPRPDGLALDLRLRLGDGK